MTNKEYLIQRLEEALEIGEDTTGEIAQNPTMSYCFDCDEIGHDYWWPNDECIDHRTVASDGYEHGGIQSALEVLSYLTTDN